MLFGLLARVSEDTPERAFAQVAAHGLFALLIPIACLVIGDAVLGAEIRAGTFHFTWLSPAPVRTIVAGRWLGGWLVALVTLVPAVALSAVVAGSPQSAWAMVVATAAASAAYLGLFVLVGCVARRAAVWSLAIVFLIERLLGAALSGIAQLSPMWEGRAVFAGLAPGAQELERKGVPDGWAGVVRLAIITLVDARPRVLAPAPPPPDRRLGLSGRSGTAQLAGGQSSGCSIEPGTPTAGVAGPARRRDDRRLRVGVQVAGHEPGQRLLAVRRWGGTTRRRPGS